MTDGNGNPVFSMPVAPAYGGGGFGNGFGSDGWWVILLLLICGGGFGNGFGFGGGMYPWMNTNNDVQRGFDQSALVTGITGVQNAVTNGFGTMQSAVSNGFSQAEIAANARQIADMQQNFALQSGMQNCCCENRASIADLKYTVATEACADRNAISNALRDVLAATSAQTQTILDKMCQQEIENLKERNLALQNQVNMQNLAASQVAQTAQLIADNTAQTQYIVNRVAPYPIPAYTVANPATPAA